jgi:hypothetical protein
MDEKWCSERRRDSSMFSSWKMAETEVLSSLRWSSLRSSGHLSTHEVRDAGCGEVPPRPDSNLLLARDNWTVLSQVAPLFGN